MIHFIIGPLGVTFGTNGCPLEVVINGSHQE